ncbi:MAG: hypothetical protein ABIO31_13385 [Candidatus Nitrotoga sp.]
MIISPGGDGRGLHDVVVIQHSVKMPCTRAVGSPKSARIRPFTAIFPYRTHEKKKNILD